MLLFFFHWHQDIFYLTLFFRRWNCNAFGVERFGFILLGTFTASWIWGFCVFRQTETFSGIVSSPAPYLFPPSQLELKSYEQIENAILTYLVFLSLYSFYKCYFQYCSMSVALSYWATYQVFLDILLLYSLYLCFHDFTWSIFYCCCFVFVVVL